MPLQRTLRALEAEIGSSLTAPINAVTGLAWIDDYEEAAELRWPANIPVFDRMGRTDAQTAATLRTILLPARGRVRYSLGRDGVDPRVHQFCEDELGLNQPQQARARRTREGIVLREHLRVALRNKLTFGHGVFEQVYRVGPPSPDQQAPGMPPVVGHLRKLALRPPRSIARFDVARDGGLTAVAQYVPATSGFGMETVSIPIERLVLHVNEREGANWRGESLLRASYKHWLVKDALIKIGAQTVERNGMGLPIVTYDEAQGANRATAIALAKSIRAGAQAAIALPTGYTLELKGVSGSTKDELPLVRYHDQQIGKNALAMFLDLGHDNGARSLGDTFLELWTLAENATVEDFCEEMTEYVIRDLVRLSFGDDEPYPALVASELTPDQALSAQDLARLVDAGVIIPDDELEAEIRRRNDLPMWPGAPVGDLDFAVADVIGVNETPRAVPAPAQPALPPGAPSMAGRSTEELSARLAAVQGQLAARAAAADRPPGRRAG